MGSVTTSQGDRPAWHLGGYWPRTVTPVEAFKWVPGAGGRTQPGSRGGCAAAWTAGTMRRVLFTALLTVVLAPWAQAVWLGRLDPRQVRAPLLVPAPSHVGPGDPRPPGGPRSLWLKPPVPARPPLALGGWVGLSEGPWAPRSRGRFKGLGDLAPLTCSSPTSFWGPGTSLPWPPARRTLRWRRPRRASRASW